MTVQAFTCPKFFITRQKEVFPMLIRPQDGGWYIVATCEKCAATIFLFPDLNSGAASLNATYQVTCPRCCHKGYYEGRHYQHAKGDLNLESAH